MSILPLEMRGRHYSAVFILVRWFGLYLLCIRSSWMAAPFIVSEFAALVSSVVALSRGVVSRGFSIVPVLYLVPVLFVSRGVLPDERWLALLLACSGFQIVTRAVLGMQLTVGNAVFYRVVDRFPYSLVRHPLAVIEAALCLSMGLTFPSHWNLFVAALGCCGFVLTAFLEERHLRRFAEYREYSGRVRYRFLPGLI